MIIYLASKGLLVGLLLASFQLQLLLRIFNLFLQLCNSALMLNQSAISGCNLLTQALNAGMQWQDPDFLNLRQLGLQFLLVCLQCTARQTPI